MYMKSYNITLLAPIELSDKQRLNAKIQLPNLPFQLQQGRCANYDGDHVMFTAGYNKGYDTYIWNGSGHTIGNGFSRSAEPDFDHYDGGLMGYEIDGKKGKGF